MSAQDERGLRPMAMSDLGHGESRSERASPTNGRARHPWLNCRGR